MLIYILELFSRKGLLQCEIINNIKEKNMEGTEILYTPLLYQTFWALIPPIIAIILALITKEVYSSLFIGITIGGILFGICDVGGDIVFDFEKTVNHIFQDGLVGSLSNPSNIGILIFLIMLGIMVCLMNEAGGSAAFGKWASTHIKSRVGTMIAAIVLGMLIFIDDYFNCLTVGSVMRPVTDNQKISRAKLAYLIDATAAPVCIIAPISSWAAAVSGFVEGEDGFTIFIKAIPYNYYALFTILALFTLVLLKVDFGPMKVHEKNAANGDLLTVKDAQYEKVDYQYVNPNGKVIDLVFPIAVLIISCVIGMIYTGGFFAGEDFVTAFSNSDASVGLMLGSFFALVITIVFYLCRRAMKFTKICECIPEGFKSMVPAILILAFAWTLKSMTDSLGAKDYVAGIVTSMSGDLINTLPAIIFLIAVLLAFATGTSWGTFGILIPIVVDAFQNKNPELMIIAISACMAGAVCGDHCSPISDTTIMASAGAQCNHVSHVSTQIPYVMVVLVISCLGYVIAGFVQNPVVPIVFGVVSIIGIFVCIKYVTKTSESTL